jgi:hypothetical protein
MATGDGEVTIRTRAVGGDRGQAAVAVLTACTAMFVALALAAATMGERLLDRTRAQTLADAAALAAVVDGRSTAALLVRRQGGAVVSVHLDDAGTTAVVVVRVDSATATSRASIEP